MPKKTVYRLLQTMISLRYVRQDKSDGKYCLALRLFELGSKAFEYISLNESAYYYMNKLSEILKETVNLGVLDDGFNVHSLHCVYAGHKLCVSPPIGRRLPVYTCALGKVMAAWLDPEDTRNSLKEMVFTSFTMNTLRDACSFIDELARVRQQGYAEDNEETELGLYCLAVPIYDRLGHVIAALSLSLPKIRLQKDSQQQLILQLHQAAAAISEKIGYHGYSQSPCMIGIQAG